MPESVVSTVIVARRDEQRQIMPARRIKRVLDVAIMGRLAEKVVPDDERNIPENQPRSTRQVLGEIGDIQRVDVKVCEDQTGRETGQIPLTVMEEQDGRDAQQTQGQREPEPAEGQDGHKEIDKPRAHKLDGDGPYHHAVAKPDEIGMATEGVEEGRRVAKPSNQFVPEGLARLRPRLLRHDAEWSVHEQGHNERYCQRGQIQPEGPANGGRHETPGAFGAFPLSKKSDGGLA